MVYGINMTLAIINLLPIYPLDGYNIIKVMFGLFKINERKIKIVQNLIEVMVIILLMTIGIVQFLFLNNLSIILMAFYIFIQSSSLRKNWDSAMYQKCYKNITNF